MKKFIASFIACLALVQSSYAATSALTESLLEYEVITTTIGTDPIFQNIIPPTEFIIDIKRLTRQVNNLGEVKYGILTRVLSSDSTTGCDCHKRHHFSNRYIATLNVAPNGIGPNKITLVSLVPLHEQDDDHHH